MKNKDEIKEVKVEKNSVEGRVSANSRSGAEGAHGVDVDGDGKVGSVSIRAMLIGLIISVVCSVCIAEVVDNKSAGTGTYTLEQASNGTGDITLTVDKLSAITTDATGEGTVNTAATVTASVSNSSIGDAAIRQTTLVLLNTPVGIYANVSPTNGFGGGKIYDFPEGEVYVHGAVFAGGSLNIATNFVITGSGAHISFGTATAVATTGTVYQTGTSADLMASIDIDPYTNSVAQFTGVLGSAAYHDGTATAKDAYLNVTVNEDNITSNCTAYVSGTYIITWSNLGDK